VRWYFCVQAGLVYAHVLLVITKVSYSHMQSSFFGIRTQVRKTLGASLPWLGVVVLSGCAYAPGMYMSKAPATTEVKANSNPWSITTDRGVSEVASDARSDAPPEGALIPITAELVRSQRAALSSKISEDVTKFFGSAQPYRIDSGDVLNIIVWDHPELVLMPAGGISTDPNTASVVGNGYNVNSQGLIQFPYVGAIKVGGLTEYDARDLLIKKLSKYLKDPQVTVRIQSYRSGRVYVDGEVKTPGLQSINDMPMTLPEVIGRAGGFSSLADRSTIVLTRDGATSVVDFNKLIENGINPSNILLKSGDLVRVSSREESKVFVLGEVLKPSTQLLRNGRLSLNEALGDSGGFNPVSSDPRQIFVVRASGKFEKPEIYHLDASSPVAYALADSFELHARDVVYVDPTPLVRWNRVISLILPSAQAVYTTRSTFN